MVPPIWNLTVGSIVQVLRKTNIIWRNKILLLPNGILFLFLQAKNS